MAAFLTPLRMETIGPRRWLLIDALVYQTDLLKGTFVVPRGFQTDLASIPRVLWVLAPPVDVYDRAAVLHDAGYGNALETPDHQRVFLIKGWCDRLFHEALRSCGVSGWRAQAMYQAVAQFGDPVGHPLAAHRGGTVSPA